MKAKIRPRKSARKQNTDNGWWMLTLLAVGVVLLGVGLVSYISAPPSANASSDYNPEDVVNDKPVLAIHEMVKDRLFPSSRPVSPSPKSRSRTRTLTSG